MGVTNLTGLQILPTKYGFTEVKNGDFFSFPQLTQEEIDMIQEDKLTPGIVVYNKTFNVYMAYMEERWNNINTSLTYKGEGYEFGSPYAVPVGPKSVIEAPESGNTDPGAMYADSENDYALRFCNGTTWADVGSGGGGGDTFTNITVTDTATIQTANIDTINTAYVAATSMSTNIIVTNIIEAGGTAVLGEAQILAGAQIGGLDTFSRLAGTSQPSGVPYLNPAFRPASDPGTDIEMRGSDIAGEIRLTTPSTVAASEGLYIQFDLAPNNLDTGLIAFSLTPSSAAAAAAFQYFYVETVPSTGIIGTGAIIKIFKRLTTLLPNTQYYFFYHMIGNKQL